jgi:phosphosulfolactate phosphohydrolase-like enzyme
MTEGWGVQGVAERERERESKRDPTNNCCLVQKNQSIQKLEYGGDVEFSCQENEAGTGASKGKQ